MPFSHPLLFFCFHVKDNNNNNKSLEIWFGINTSIPSFEFYLLVSSIHHFCICSWAFSESVKLVIWDWIWSSSASIWFGFRACGRIFNLHSFQWKLYVHQIGSPIAISWLQFYSHSYDLDRIRKKIRSSFMFHLCASRPWPGSGRCCRGTWRSSTCSVSAAGTVPEAPRRTAPPWPPGSPGRRRPPSSRRPPSAAITCARIASRRSPHGLLGDTVRIWSPWLLRQLLDLKPNNIYIYRTV